MRKDINGIKISWPLYHITLNTRIESILQHGLLPAKDFKRLGFDQPYPSDDDYVYLFNSIRMHKNINKVLTESEGSWLKDKELLEVKIPSAHPLEREYDQATISLRLSGEALDWFLEGRKQNSAEDYVRYYFQKTYGIEYTGKYTIEDVIGFLDSNISDVDWDENDGSYRTPKPISSKYLRIISVEKFSTL
jgi:hypothetical protein